MCKRLMTAGRLGLTALHMPWCISSVQHWGQTTGIRQQKSNTKLPVALTQPASEQPACDWCRHKIQVSEMKGCLVNSSEGSGMVSTLNCSAPWLWLQTEELLLLCQDLNEGSDTIPSDATSKSRVLHHWKIQSQPASDGFYPHKVKKKSQWYIQQFIMRKKECNF